MVMKRQLGWVSTEQGFGTLAAGASSRLTLYQDSTFGGRHTKGATVTRTIAKIWLRSDSVAQENDMAWGIAVMNGDVPAGSPDPSDMSDRPGWLIRDYLRNAQDSLLNSAQWTLAHMDLRSQRILRSEEEVVRLQVKNDGANILQWAAFVRLLIKLPV